MARHKSITAARIMTACESGEYVGFCSACGKTAHDVEPDARKCKCEHCGQDKVYGAEEYLIAIA